MEAKYALMFFALLPLVSAVPQGVEEFRGQALGAAMEDIYCKTDFSVAVLESLISHTDDSDSLNSDIDALETDTQNLQNYADDNDVEAFRTYLKDSYGPHLKDATEAAKSWRTGHSGLEPSARKEIRDEYTDLRETYDQCNKDALNRFSEARINAAEQELEKAEKVVANLSSKGVDTSGLSALISEARSEIVEPLQSALDAATTGKELSDALHAYCLNSGCKTGNNFHFAAKFDIEQIGSILDYIESDADSAGLSGKVSDARSSLGSAQSKLDEVGSSSYGSLGDREDVWKDIRDAAATVKEILSEMRSSS